MGLSFSHLHPCECVTLLCSSARLRFGKFGGGFLASFCYLICWCQQCICGGKIHGVTAGHVRWKSVVVVAIRAQNLTAVGEEAGAHQRDGAARTLEARLVPLPVLERNVFPVSKTCRDTRRGRGGKPVRKTLCHVVPTLGVFENLLVAAVLAHNLH